MNKKFFMITMLMTATMLADASLTVQTSEGSMTANIESNDTTGIAPVEAKQEEVLVANKAVESKKVSFMLLAEAEETFVDAVKKNCPGASHDDCIAALQALLRSSKGQLVEVVDTTAFVVPAAVVLPVAPTTPAELSADAPVAQDEKAPEAPANPDAK